jgi:hypothetical protein
MTPTNLFIFIVAALGRVSVNLIGDLYITEIILLFTIFYLGKGFSWLLKSRTFNMLMIFAGLWLLNQMITDVYRATPLLDWTRGWAKIIFLIIDFTGVALLTRFRMDRIVIFFSGIGFSLLLQYLFFPNEAQVGGEFGDGAWKFGVGAFFNMIAAVFCATKLSRRLMGPVGGYLPLIVVSLIDLALNNRSSFGLSMAAAAFGMFKQWINHSPRLRERLTLLHFVCILVGGMVLSQGIIAIYTTAAINNWLGDAAREKYEMQTTGDIGLFQGGRMESAASLQAIQDSPILGHGSWPKDVYYIQVMVDTLTARGAHFSESIYEGDPLIPTHSHALGSWVEAGVFGGLFWTIALILAIISLFETLKREDTPASFVAAILFGYAWACLFSAFSNSGRISAAGTLCLIASLISIKKQSGR